MTHTVAVSHVVGALIASAMILFTISLVIILRGGKTVKKPHIHPDQQATRRRGRRRIVAVVRRPLAALLWAAIAPVGWLVANKRYDVVAPALRPFEEGLAAQNHRVGHALCVPVLVWPQWLVRCHGCRAWVHLREVPATAGDGVDLQVVHGQLHGAGRCPVRYLTAPRPAQSTHPVQPTQPARPTVVKTDRSA